MRLIAGACAESHKRLFLKRTFDELFLGELSVPVLIYDSERLVELFLFLLADNVGGDICQNSLLELVFGVELAHVLQDSCIELVFQ